MIGPYRRRERLLLYPAYVQDYLDRVTAADVEAGNTSGLEMGVTDLASTFLQDLVSISYLGISNNVISQAASVIKASCTMAGARTRAGALVPVVGPAPTEFGTAGGWNYNRKTGTAGNGTNNYLNSNRNNNADPQNNQHISVYATTPTTAASNKYPFYIGAGYNQAGSTHIGRFGSSGNLFARNRSADFVQYGSGSSTGLIALARSTSSSYIQRNGGINSSITQASTASFNGNIFVFWSNGATSTDYSSARIAFYSIGESLDLALLDARVTTLINALSAAIP